MTDYTADATAAANQYGVPPPLFLGLIQQESAWNPNAYSSAGAIGLTQLEPGTAADLGVNPWDPLQNLQGGAEYLAQMFKQFGNWADALGAYNAGPGAYAKIKAGTQSEAPETSNYITTVLGNAKALGFNGSNVSGSASGGYTSPPSAYGTGAAGTYPNVATDLSGNPIGSYDTSGGALKIAVGGGSNAANGTSPGGGALNIPMPITALAGNLNGLFTSSFWQGALIDILIVLAILALVIFGGWRAIKSGSATAA